MMRPQRLRIGFVFVLLGSLVLSLLAPAIGSAQDAHVTAADTVPPVITQPVDIVWAAVDASGAAVNYSVPAANDAVDGAVPVSCLPAPGVVFPLGQTVVKCTAHDAANNQSAITFKIIVTDQTPPVIAAPAPIVVDAADPAGAVVNYPVPGATDNVNGPVAVGCNKASGSVFPVGTTVVTCTAQDAAGNQAAPVTFTVTVNPPPDPTPTDVPTQEPTDVPTDEPTATETPTKTPAETEEPSATNTPGATDTPDMTETPTPVDPPPGGVPSDGSETPTPTPTEKATKTPTPKPTNETRKRQTPTATPTAIPTNTPEALELQWPRPDSFLLVTDGGPIDGLAAMWGGQDFPISQEFGHTLFSVQHNRMYAYGVAYGLDGFEHPGIDIGMPAGTPLYSPVKGTVKIAGGTPYYTFYGNGKAGVGELLIETDNGDEVILGHMGRIVVTVGQKVKPGQFLGLSGGDNGDHLHLETREIQGGTWYRVVDPRKSFLVPAIAKASKDAERVAKKKQQAAEAKQKTSKSKSKHKSKKKKKT